MKTEGDGPMKRERRFWAIPLSMLAAAMLLASCSGGDDPHDRQAAEEAGADFILGKPLDLALCQELISHHEIA